MSGSPTKISPSAAPKFDHVEVWIFDLDNTLYSHEHNLFAQIDKRMGEFISNYLAIDVAAARRLQKDYFHRHGTTLRGLMVEHGMRPDDYLDYVHEIDLSAIPPNARLDDALGRLSGRKIIFTNANRPHAERVTERLGIRHHFDVIFDVVDSDYLPKPDRRPYEKLLSLHNIAPERALMVEDIARNLEPAAELGMITALVPNPNHWSRQGADCDHVHHVIDDLTDWLSTVVAPLEAKPR